MFFCHRATPQEQSAAGFGVEFDWDVSLLDGYQHRFLRNVARKPSLHSFNGINTPDIKAVIRKKEFDAVIINGWHYRSAWQAMRACWQTGTPVMARGDSNLRTERGLAKQLTKMPLYRWFVPRLDACLPVGRLSRDYFLHYGARSEHIFVVPHVVDTEFFRRESARLRPQQSELRRHWQLDEASTVFLFAGKFIKKKRPQDFVEAIASAHKRGARVMGLMVGDGPLRQTCEETVRTLGAPIRFAGFLNQSKISAAYAAADALVLPTDGETWGMVVNEAMSCGRPCFVSSRVGCAPDLITSGETGEVFPVGDIESLGSLLYLYASRRDHLQEMGSKAYRQMATYSVEAAVKGTLQAINATLERRRN